MSPTSNSIALSSSVPANLSRLQKRNHVKRDFAEGLQIEELIEADSEDQELQTVTSVDDGHDQHAQSAESSEDRFKPEEILSRTRSIGPGKEELAVALALSPTVELPPSPMPSSQRMGEDEAHLFLAKQARFDYFTNQVNFFRELANIGFRLRSVLPAENRIAHLRQELDQLNLLLPSGVYLPVCKADAPYARILRIPIQEAVCLNSREKVPYLIYLEVTDTEHKCSDPNLYDFAIDISAEEIDAKKRWLESRKRPTGSSDAPPSSLPAPAPPNSSSPKIQAQSGPLPSFVNDLKRLGGDVDKPEDLLILQAMMKNMKKDSDKEKNLVGFKFEHQDKVFSETWADKMHRMRATSPYGHLPNWKIISVIVKSGDDCRQEQLALHLIEQFDIIFKEAKLPLWLRPYACVVMSSHSALIETVPNAPSVTTLKKQTADFTTLAKYFRKTYGDENSMSFKLAQRNFVESMAGYSIVTYLLQIKDRHNGNILLDQEGHVVHIDFGFMLSNSPGSINFETAPFKLTVEQVEVMGGEGSDAFNYFKYLCVRGYLEVRKHHEKILSMVDMMRKGSKLACFMMGKASVDALRDRFNIHMTEQQAVDFMMQLIDESMNNWRTRQYDNFQRLTNGIL